jgi:molybdate-binding protein/DNA-binding transcriptional regulator YhcF (GntR family)
MDRTPLYQQIAESVRRQIKYNELCPGDRLPSVREMATRWHCTPGTVQRAYRELAHHGLVISHRGQGTRVVIEIPAREDTPLRRAALVHQAEAFLLEVLTAGYSPTEVEQAMRLALDHWRTMTQEPSHPAADALRFVGSHDPAVALIAARFSEIIPDHALRLTFAGSLGGLIALAKGEADLAGSHLWDEESDTYNRPFVRRLLPGRRVALLTLAHRRLGLILPAGNPAGVTGLEDPARAELRFVNRQRGAGTRVWLDARLRHLGLSPEQVTGYGEEKLTHSGVTQAIAEGRADVGLGVEAAARAYGLDFLCLTTERYDLVVPAQAWEYPSIRALARWLSTEAAKSAITALGGYDTHETGQVAWVD